MHFLLLAPHIVSGVTQVATILYVTLTLIVLAVIIDRLFGRFVTTRIREVFENVPPFGVVPAAESSDARKIRIPTSDGLILSVACASIV